MNRSPTSSPSWFESLPTPAVIVDRSRLLANIDRAQALADAAGLALRPHIKTHRCIELARRQRDRGAAGITCAKLGEAFVFVEAGFEDIRVAYPVIGVDKLDRLAALSRQARVSFCVDSLEGARAASARFLGEARKAQVLIKIDCGYGRAGVRWDDDSLPEFTRNLESLQGIEITGVLTHAGQAYGGPAQGQDPVAVLRVHAQNERDRAESAAERVASSLPRRREQRFEVSVGSTPTLWQFEPSTCARFPVTELRPGNYIFHDLTQVDLGAATHDQCALSVLATIVSRKERDRGFALLVDAGKKTLTSDRRVEQSTYGQVLDSDSESQRPLPGVHLHTLSEEHGWLDAPSNFSGRVGDRVRILVNHSCVVVSTQTRLYEVDGPNLVGVLEVDARGCSV